MIIFIRNHIKIILIDFDYYKYYMPNNINKIQKYLNAWK